MGCCQSRAQDLKAPLEKASDTLHISDEWSCKFNMILLQHCINNNGPKANKMKKVAAVVLTTVEN